MELESVVKGVRRRWWIVILLLVVGMLVAAVAPPGVDSADAKRFSATHTLLLSKVTGDGSAASLTTADVVLFATTGEVPKRAAQLLGYAGSPPDLAAEVKVTVDSATGSVRFTTTQPSPEQAVAVADTFAEQLISYLVEREDVLRLGRIDDSLQRQSDLSVKITALQALLAQKPDDAVLADQLAGLNRSYSSEFENYDRLQSTSYQTILVTVEAAHAALVDPARSLVPSTRGSRGVLGALVGAILGVGVVTILNRVDRLIRSQAEAERAFGMECLAVIPEVKQAPTGLVVVPERQDSLAVAFRRLRTVVAFVEQQTSHKDGRPPVIVVVSAGSGDGKTTLVANLAAAFAESGVVAVAVNTDFRRPTLSTYVTGKASDTYSVVAADVATLPVELLLDKGTIDNLYLLDLAGLENPPVDTVRITASFFSKMADIGAGVIIVDTSPVDSTAEALSMIVEADVVLVVARVNHTDAAAAHRTAESVKALAPQRVMFALIDEISAHASREYGRYAVVYAGPERRRGGGDRPALERDSTARAADVSVDSAAGLEQTGSLPG